MDFDLWVKDYIYLGLNMGQLEIRERLIPDPTEAVWQAGCLAGWHNEELSD